MTGFSEAFSSDQSTTERANERTAMLRRLDPVTLDLIEKDIDGKLLQVASITKPSDVELLQSLVAGKQLIRMYVADRKRATEDPEAAEIAANAQAARTQYELQRHAPPHTTTSRGNVQPRRE